MTASNYIVYATMALYVVVLITIPFRIKKHGTESLKGRGAAFWAREVAIFLAAAAIIVLCRFIHFEPVPTAALCGCGVIAAWIGTQEL